MNTTQTTVMVDPTTLVDGDHINAGGTRQFARVFGSSAVMQYQTGTVGVLVRCGSRTSEVYFKNGALAAKVVES